MKRGKEICVADEDMGGGEEVLEFGSPELSTGLLGKDVNEELADSCTWEDDDFVLDESQSFEDQVREELGLDVGMKKRLLLQREVQLERTRKNFHLCTLRNLQAYKPGSWIAERSGRKVSEYAVPDVTTLLLVGLKGAGKSSLINQILRAFNLDVAPDGFHRAQVCDDPLENGTYFMEEFRAWWNPKGFCVFDSRGLPETDTREGLSLLETWMTEGVQHAQIVVSDSDSIQVKEALEIKGRHGQDKLSKKRTVNFVIFVVNGASVLKMQADKDKEMETHLVQLYKNSFLTFKDDRPVVVMTHGDQLSRDDRTNARLFIGQIFGVPPDYQVFDISGKVAYETETDRLTDATVLDMLEFALEQADCNLPYKLPWKAFFKQAFASASSTCQNRIWDDKASWIIFAMCLYAVSFCCVAICLSLSSRLVQLFIPRWSLKGLF